MARVLIVEDSKPASNLLVRHLTRAWPKAEELHIDVHTNVPDAEEALRKGSYDIILLDEDLENGTHGSDLLYTIREDMQLKTPVICTSNRSSSSILDCIGSAYRRAQHTPNDERLQEAARGESYSARLATFGVVGHMTVSRLDALAELVHETVQGKDGASLI